MLDQNSAITKAFRMARDWCHSHVSVNMELRLPSERTSSRQYNASTVAEDVALITNDFGDGEPTRDIIVNKKDKDGYHNKISYHANTWKRKTSRDYVIMKEYYAYVIQYRKEQGTTLLRGGRLYQQYLVNAYTVIEEQRLSWTRNNQDTLRVDLYRNVCDVVTRGDINAAVLGKRIVLPHTFTGGPRYTMQNYQDVMALCRAYAELPSLTDDPEGHEAVTDYMLHGPCGKGDACNIEGKCSKYFPKAFCTETKINQDGYPIYRQRDNKVCVKKGKFTFDNKYVVPHNRYLLLKYQAHINVEWCNRSKAIKYLFKYLNKGPDKATIVIKENVPNGQGVALEKVTMVDEIKNYLNCRYLASCEAVWRIFLFDIHYAYPSVMKLNFHLPNQHPVTLRDSECLHVLLEREGINVTMFTD
ncbi:DNA helicase PIF1, ATP-dependent [Tanacetum coccineum]